jgi:hypothetical protein
MHGELAEKVQGTRCAMRGSDNLDEAIQDIAVVLHEHFRPDTTVSSSNICACSQVHDEIRVGLALKASL